MVSSAQVKMANNKKQYLDMVLFDGTNKINAKIWNWSSPSVPASGNIIDVVAVVGEWQGKKQLTVEDFRDSMEHTADDFKEKAPFDLIEYQERLSRLHDNIGNEVLSDVVYKLIYGNNFESFISAPAAKGIHHAYVGGLLRHSVEVAETGLAIASCYPGVDTDLIIAGGLLHDIGKLLTYVSANGSIGMTPIGSALDHIIIGGSMVDALTTEENAATLTLVKHIIASHHGKLEWGSPVTPICKEALIVHQADMLSSSMDTITEADKSSSDPVYTEKIYTQGNRQFYKQSTIDNILG